MSGSDASTTIDALVRPAIRALVPYVSARSLTTRGNIFLDANESADAPVARMNRYPEPQPAALLARFAELYGVPTASIVIGRGSDEAIDLLVRTFCEPGVDRVLICPPTYGVYEVAAAIQGCGVTRVPLLPRDAPAARPTFALDLDAIVARADKLIFLCSPNNPTGTAFDPDALAAICARTLGRSIVVVDEAYAEFSDRASLLGALAAHPNLVVLRTLSKARALAGVRCGVAIASPAITAYLHRVRAPYPIATPQLDVALAAIAPAAETALRTRIAEACARRDQLAARLATAAGVHAVYASAANFLLVRFSDDAHARVLAAAARAGIVLRDRSREPGLAGCIRITIGTADDNARVLELAAEAAP